MVLLQYIWRLNWEAFVFAAALLSREGMEWSVVNGVFQADTYSNFLCLRVDRFGTQLLFYVTITFSIQ